jgi:tRNA pseudouridine13 synthase
MMEQLPYLTADMPGVGGEIKSQSEDFFVEEIPRYLPSGEGQHTYLFIEKVGMTTMAAINRIAQSLGVSNREVGYAGLKDAHAVTRQMISVGDVPLERAESLDLAGIKVLSINRHRNKIKVGHLAGNRFVIRVRGVEEKQLGQAKAILTHLAGTGVPNYFGEQRFGLRNNSHRLGLALIKGETREFLAELLGRPHPDENPLAQKARSVFDQGDWPQALELWPKSLRDEWQVLQALVKSGNEAAAVNRLNKQIKRFFVCAYQSFLFNKLLVDRLPTLNQIETGDIAFIHQNQASFLVESAAEVQPRADQFEVSPSGPLYGSNYLSAQGKPGQREQALLTENNIQPRDFDLPGIKLKGARRPYRMPLAEPNIWWDDGIMVAFELPPGGYATMVLREITKN